MIENRRLPTHTCARSLKHCKLFVEQGKVFIEDLGSTNGTSVNDTKITEASEIRAGDVIALGRTRFIVWM